MGITYVAVPMAITALLILVFLISEGLATPSSVAVHSIFQAGQGLYRLRWSMDVSAETRSVSGTTSWISTVRSPSSFLEVAPTSPALALDPATGELFTMALLPSSDSWHVCRWTVDPLRGDSRPTCSTKPIAARSAGEPTSMVHLGVTDDLLLVAFPEAGDVLALTASTLVPRTTKWATGLAAPVSLAYNPVSSTVYVALLDAGAIVRFATSGGTSLDPPNAPWISIAKPRFILSNQASPTLATSGEPAFFVMCMSSVNSEVHFFDSNGNSLGSSADEASEWVCDEPGYDPNSNSIPRIISVALDPTTMTMSVARGGYDAIDYYVLDSGIPRRIAPLLNGTAPLLHPLGLYTQPGIAKPSGIADAYQFIDPVTGRQAGIYLRCDPLAASGATVRPARGVWGCSSSNEGIVLLYDDMSVYQLYVDDVAIEVCFSKYLYIVADERRAAGITIEDTYLAEGVLYAMHSDGSVIALPGACDSSSSQPVTPVLVAGTVDGSLLSVPQNDFVVVMTGNDSNATPCIMTRYGFHCEGASGGSEAQPVCQQKNNGLPLSGIAIGFNRVISSRGVLIVSGTDASGDKLFMELHEFAANGTDNALCLGPYERPDNASSLRLVIDSDSGAFGWIDSTTGALYEINTDSLELEQVGRGIALPDLGNGSPPIGVQHWTLTDALGQSGRFPAPPSTSRPTSESTSTSSKGLVTALIILGCIVLLLLLLLLTGLAIFYVAVLRRRRADSRSTVTHADGKGPRTYHSDDRDTSAFYTLPSGVRRLIRKTVCCFTCCYGSTGHLRFCGSCLGGRIETARSYSKMQEDELRVTNNDNIGLLPSLEEETTAITQGDPLPRASTSATSAPKPSHASVTPEDRALGDSPLEEVNLYSKSSSVV